MIALSSVYCFDPGVSEMEPFENSRSGRIRSAAVAGLTALLWIAFGIDLGFVVLAFVIGRGPDILHAVEIAIVLMLALAAALAIIHAIEDLATAVRANAQATAEALRSVARGKNGADD
jgi:hypothetical protein